MNFELNIFAFLCLLKNLPNFYSVKIDLNDETIHSLPYIRVSFYGSKKYLIDVQLLKIDIPLCFFKRL